MTTKEIPNGLWADSGVRGFGCVHPPKYEGRVATVDTFGAGFGYYSVHLSDVRVAVAALGDTKTPIKISDRASGQLGSLASRTFERQALYDALHALGYLVVTTHSGGTYLLARGEMPRRTR